MGVGVGGDECHWPAATDSGPFTISLTMDALPALFTIIDTSTRQTRQSYECHWPAATDSGPFTINLTMDALPALFTIIDTSTRQTRQSYECH